MPIKTILPIEARKAIDAGARLVDIRGADEHARERIAGAVCVPLERLSELTPNGQPVVFHCRSGMRTAANADRLSEVVAGSPAFILEGGIDAWRAAGHATIEDRAQPLEIMRQVQIVAGSLVVIGILLGLCVAPALFGLSAFVGAGLLFAGVTGWCGMANLLRVMPWNRRVAS